MPKMPCGCLQTKHQFCGKESGIHDTIQGTSTRAYVLITFLRHDDDNALFFQGSDR